MRQKLNMESIQKLNLFSRITGVRTKNFFTYNNCMVFVVLPNLMQRALGDRGENIRKLCRALNSKVRIIPYSHLGPFVRFIVYPVRFKKIINERGEVIIIAGGQAKASLIGRNKVRVNELGEILKQYFEIKSLRII